jgi:hypothetical protein
MHMTTYQERFARISADDFQLYGDILVVEEFQAGPMTKDVVKADGSKVQLILDVGNAGGTRQVGSMQDIKPLLVRVLLAGRGYYDPETGKTTPLDEQPGDIIEIPKQSVSWRSEVCGVVVDSGARLGIVKVGEILGRYPGGEAAYRRVVEATTR